MKVLLIEDDRETSADIGRRLCEQGHVVNLAVAGRDGLSLVPDHAHDVLIVDRMLAGLNGMALVQALRSTGVRTPVLFLTALGGVDNWVKGLKAGGDDYLVKPFAFAELLARINALARQPPLSHAPTVLRVAGLELDLLTRTVMRGSNRIALQPQEFRLLQELMRNADHVVTRTMLLKSVWAFSFAPKTNVVETHISRLRAMLNQYGGPELIQTVRNAGYALRSSVSDRP